jgi:hypothetical protein
MLLLRTPGASSTSKSKQITRVWGNDGWCYIPELRVRQRFSATTDSQTLEFTSETWDGVIPIPQYQEQVTYSLLSAKPLSWQEQGTWGSERYAETTFRKHTPSA